MQFRVPQFLDIEDTIFGPFTFKQFVYLVGGGAICFVIYKLIGLLAGIIPILIVAGFACALAFYRPNNKPLVNMLENGFNYYTQSKLYIWKRRKAKPGQQKKPEEEIVIAPTPKLDKGKLRDLAWSLDVLDLKKEENQEN
ncbi:MAG: hypothetical protein QG644_560 [Patescibacteria group bacterium]|nr:hypothetical protein [Patescibacteria group bacterium]